MAVGKSKRTSATAVDASKLRKLRNRRGQRGYRMFRNGLLNVTPIGHEIAIKKNSKDSPLLRLPAEIRGMIWKYALGGHIIPMPSPNSVHPRWPEISFNLLTVCRQVYAEAALFLCTMNTFSFWCFVDYLDDEAAGKLRHVRTIKLGTCLDTLTDPITLSNLMPVAAYTSLRSVEIILCGDAPGNQKEAKKAVEDSIRSLLHGKEVTIRYAKELDDWLVEWTSGVRPDA